MVDYLDLQIMTNNCLLSGDDVTPIAPSDANLVAYYAFENNLLDGTGNGNNGDPYGAPVYVPGQIGSALELDGSPCCVPSVSMLVGKKTVSLIMQL